MTTAGAVIGLGIDLVEVEGFAGQLGRAGTSFADRTFTASEIAVALESGEPGSLAFARHLAARFAAKEAFVKAWSAGRVGCRPAMDSVSFGEVEIAADSWDRPRLVLSGATARCVAETLGQIDISVSLTHEDSMAAAVVVISGRAG